MNSTSSNLTRDNNSPNPLDMISRPVKVKIKAKAKAKTRPAPSKPSTPANPSAAGRKIDAYLDAVRVLDEIDYDRSINGVAFDEGGPRHQGRYSAKDADAALDALGEAKDKAIRAIRSTAKVGRSPLAGVVHGASLYVVMDGEHLEDVPDGWKTRDFRTIIVVPLGSLAGLSVS